MKCFYSYLLLYISLILLSSSSNGSSDLEVLWKLKSSMIAPNALGLEDWEFSVFPSAHCHFFGVHCDEDFRVVDLNVSFAPLFGTISPEIGLLNKLVNRIIMRVSLTGKITMELGNLTSLKIFNISNNAFQGSFLGEIFTSMTQLEILDAYNNYFMGLLPIKVANLKNLKHISLVGNYFNFNGEIPEKYSNIQSFEYLV